MLGETIGPYHVESLLGRGGMGEVYRARDGRLDRDVALKILPADLSGNRDRLGRFEREARLLAALQHQNIASIYGLEECDGQPVLVMELAEGEDLSQRLEAGPLDVDEVERIARQLARGLEFAHERGIVHRDLKPANIKVGPDGRVKILDFGLARAYTGITEGSGLGSSPAMTQATRPQELTIAGTVLGTAAYMSPEQARGYEVDRRTDIWAFGVILFEMLTGRRLFTGETGSDVLAAILRQEPDFAELPAETPPVVMQLIRRCLQKDPQLRLRDVGEVRIALEDGSSSVLAVGSGSSIAPAVSPLPARRQPLPWILVAVLAVLLGGVLTMGMSGHLGPRPAPPPLVRAQIPLPEKTTFHLNPARPGPPVISPDGRTLAYSGLDSTGRIMLFVQNLGETEAHGIAGTQGAAYPFWAPNSREIAFFADNDLNRVDIAGGPVVPICPAENGKGGSWHRNDIILLAPTHVSPILRVDASGGEAVPVTSLEADSLARSHRFPCWLPDGEHFVYLSWRHANAARESGNETVLRLGSLDGSVDRELMPSQTNAIYTEDLLLHIHEGNLMSRPFSWESLEFTGPPRPLLGGVLALQSAHVGVFSATAAGVLTYVAGGGVFGLSQLLWLDPDGQELGKLGSTVISPQGMSVSPTGSRVAVSQADERAGTFDIWTYEPDRDVGARFTFEAESEMTPIWSADGRWITYSASSPNSAGAIFHKQASGAGRAEILVERRNGCFPSSWSPDDRRLLFTTGDDTGDFDIWMYDRDRPDSLQVFRDTPFNEGQAVFSPDGAWLAYVSDETGEIEVFVESLTAGGGRYRISSATGSHPTWAPDAERIYYLDSTGNLLATRLTAVGTSMIIGETATITSGLEVDLQRTFDVDPSTGNLLLQRPLQDRVSDRLQLVTGWQNLLSATNGR